MFCIYVLMGFSRNQHDVSAKFVYSHGSLAALLIASFCSKEAIKFSSMFDGFHQICML